MSDDEYLKVDSESLLVDFGATTHIVNDRTLFTAFDKSYCPSEHFIELADGSRQNNIAKARGTVVIFLNGENGRKQVTLKNTLYIPTYPQNIFSVQTAMQNGC